MRREIGALCEGRSELYAKGALCGSTKHDRFEHAPTMNKFNFLFMQKKVIKRSFYRQTHFIWCVYG